MDNRINEIRRKVSALRAQMVELEELARNQVKHDLDCSEAAARQLALRREMVGLIGEWKAAGAGDRLPSPPGASAALVWRTWVGDCNSPSGDRINLLPLYVQNATQWNSDGQG